MLKYLAKKFAPLAKLSSSMSKFSADSTSVILRGGVHLSENREVSETTKTQGRQLAIDAAGERQVQITIAKKSSRYSCFSSCNDGPCMMQRRYSTESAAGDQEYEPDDDAKNEIYLKELDRLRNDRSAWEVAAEFERWRNEGLKANLQVFERLLTALCAGGDKKDLKSAANYVIEMSEKFPTDQDLIKKSFNYVIYHCKEPRSRKLGLIKKLEQHAEKLNLKLD